MSSSRRVAIPTGFPVGALFGKGAARLKEVQSRTGARVRINGDGGYIDVVGASYAVSAAVALYEEQFEEHNSAGVTAYPHPCQAHILLQDANSGSSFTFQPAGSGDVAAQATDRSEQLYTLRISSGSAPTTADSLAGALSLLGLHASSRASVDFQAPADEPRLLQKVASCMRDAEDFEPAFDQVKLLYNFGKQFYYSVRGATPLAYHGSLALEEVQAYEVGMHLKCVYSNSVPARSLEKVRAYITQVLGFTKVQTKSTATLHLVKKSGFTSTAVSYTRKAGDVLEVRKVKSGQEKLFFLSFCYGNGLPDVRLKVTAQRNYHKDGGERDRLAWEVASLCRMYGGHITIPLSHRSAFQADKVRYKDKDVYQGRVKIPGSDAGHCTITLTISRVRDEAGKQHNEVTGACQELTGMHGGSSTGSGGAEHLKYIQAVVEFCRKVRQHM